MGALRQVRGPCCWGPDALAGHQPDAHTLGCDAERSGRGSLPSSTRTRTALSQQVAPLSVTLWGCIVQLQPKLLKRTISFSS